mmetsp:Transcript_45182/g.80814  ORF Transcript_45182/g.80814 Transcript_45182/m.80814 type:complete len:391 (+) Transcript_45182:256-1428(+)
MSIVLLHDRQRNPARPSAVGSSMPRSIISCFIWWNSTWSALVSSMPRRTLRLLSKVSTMPELAVFSVLIISRRRPPIARSTYVCSAFRMPTSVSSLRWSRASIISLRLRKEPSRLVTSALFKNSCWICLAWLFRALTSSSWDALPESNPATGIAAGLDCEPAVPLRELPPLRAGTGSEPPSAPSTAFPSAPALPALPSAPASPLAPPTVATGTWTAWGRRSISARRSARSAFFSSHCSNLSSIVAVSFPSALSLRACLRAASSSSTSRILASSREFPVPPVPNPNPGPSPPVLPPCACSPAAPLLPPALTARPAPSAGGYTDRLPAECTGFAPVLRMWVGRPVVAPPWPDLKSGTGRASYSTPSRLAARPACSLLAPTRAAMCSWSGPNN